MNDAHREKLQEAIDELWDLTEDARHLGGPVDASGIEDVFESIGKRLDALVSAVTLLSLIHGVKASDSESPPVDTSPPRDD